MHWLVSIRSKWWKNTELFCISWIFQLV